MEKHDIIVIGASAGGVEALPKILGKLPRRFPAAIFIALHIAPSAPGFLPDILCRASALPAEHPADGQIIRTSRIYVAPPDFHLIINGDRICLSHGPKENRHRPSINPLFRSAAQTFGPRVIGVILTGSLDDGTQGLFAIKQKGGMAVVQNPEEAFADGMPLSALRNVEVDYVLPLAKIPGLLLRLVGTPKGNAKNPNSKIAALRAKPDPAPRDEDQWTSFICPDCNGPLREIKQGNEYYFQCRIGHAYSPESLLEGEGEAVERSLWVAIKTLEERAVLLRRMAKELKGDAASTTRFLQDAQESQNGAEVIRAMLETRNCFRQSASVVKSSTSKREKNLRN